MKNLILYYFNINLILKQKLRNTLENLKYTTTKLKVFSFKNFPTMLKPRRLVLWVWLHTLPGS